MGGLLSRRVEAWRRRAIGEVRGADGKGCPTRRVSSQLRGPDVTLADFPFLHTRSKKTARTEGFKQQIKQHRDELQEHEAKLEGTKKGLSQWASVVGL